MIARVVHTRSKSGIEVQEVEPTSRTEISTGIFAGNFRGDLHGDLHEADFGNDAFSPFMLQR